MELIAHAKEVFATRRRGFTTVAAGLLLLLVAGITVATTVPAHGSATPLISGSGFAPSLAPVSSVDPGDAAALGILRQPLDESDAAPPGTATDASSDGTTNAYGLNYALTRQAVGLGTAGHAWLVPGDAALCLIADGDIDGVQVNGGSTCMDDPSATDGHLIVYAFSQAAPGWLLVAGVVPDGVSSVNLELPGGVTETVAASDNVYITEVHAAPRIEFTGPSGPVVIPALQLPAGSGLNGSGTPAIALPSGLG